jgi:hypothetical protein
MSQQPENKRRKFLKGSAASLLGGYVASKILREGDVAFAADVGEVKETDPQAQALGYYIDAKKVDTKKWTKRAGTDGANQFCYNCSLFQTPKGVDAKTVSSAPCPIFANKKVAGKGWCNSWAKKA